MKLVNKYASVTNITFFLLAITLARIDRASTQSIYFVTRKHVKLDKSLNHFQPRSRYIEFGEELVKKKPTVNHGIDFIKGQ